MKSMGVIPVFLMVATLALSACVPPHQFAGATYATHEEMLAAVKRKMDEVVPQTPMASEQIVGSVVVVLPDQEYIRQYIITAGVFVPASRIMENAQALEMVLLRIPEAMKAGGLFDEIKTVQSFNPEGESSGGKDYKLWYETKKGEIGSWYLSRNGKEGKAVVARERQWQMEHGFAALNELIVKAALELGATTARPQGRKSNVAEPSAESRPSGKSTTRKGSLVIYK
ncbi:MAG: hypothetical protein HQL51_09735 [Magnetococcales bacterium]|nr:hypothetical protein [Magnetococcales bacterium]